MVYANLAQLAGMLIRCYWRVVLVLPESGVVVVAAGHESNLSLKIDLDMLS